MRTHKPALAGLMLVSLVLAACGENANAAEDGIHVVATTSILGDVVSNVVGDDATVEVLMPIGADPHDFVPSSQQVASLNGADLVVANGYGLEEGLEDILETAIEDGVQVLYAANHVEPLPGHDEDEGSAEADEGDGHDEEGDHGHGDQDPHFWLDPLRMADAVLAIGEALVTVDEAIDWAAKADSYHAELLAANDEIVEILSVVGNRKMVTNHASFNYFADRYDFEIVGVVIPGGSTLGDPSSHELAELVEVIETERVQAIFTETTDSADLAEALADELDREVQVIELYTGSLGEPGSSADTYIGMLTTNTGLIADALE